MESEIIELQKKLNNDNLFSVETSTARAKSTRLSQFIGRTGYRLISVYLMPPIVICDRSRDVVARPDCRKRMFIGFLLQQKRAQVYLFYGDSQTKMLRRFFGAGEKSPSGG